MLARIALSLKLNAPNTTLPSGEIPPDATVPPGLSPFVVAELVAAAVEVAPESSLLVHDAAHSPTATAIVASQGPRRLTMLTVRVRLRLRSGARPSL